MKSPKKHIIRRLSKDNPSFQAMKGEPISDEKALYPDNPDIDAHNDKIATMLELVQRNQELKERVIELEVELAIYKEVFGTLGGE